MGRMRTGLCYGVSRGRLTGTRNRCRIWCGCLRRVLHPRLLIEGRLRHVHQKDAADGPEAENKYEGPDHEQLGGCVAHRLGRGIQSIPWTLRARWVRPVRIRGCAVVDHLMCRSNSRMGESKRRQIDEHRPESTPLLP